MPPPPAPLYECIPNVSEGRRPDVVAALAAAVTSAPGVELLHTDSGADANRTVFTFVGAAEGVRLAAKRLAAACVRHVDLRDYAGTHPYVGALDVCPVVPLAAGATMAEADDIARDVAAYCWNALAVPAYLYERSATRGPYRSLAAVRRGGLGAVAARSGADGPDFGHGRHPTAGVCVVGARDLLVAYNVNLDSRDAGVARAVAAAIRSAGPRGRPHRLPALRAIGWYQAAFGCAQVSCNLRDVDRTGLADVYAAVRAVAGEVGVGVAGSELVGMAPERALLAAGRYFAGGVTDREALVARAVEGLGLGSVRPFSPRTRVLEYAYPGGLPPLPHCRDPAV